MIKDKPTNKELSKRLVSIISSFDLDEVCPIAGKFDTCPTLPCIYCPFGSEENFKKAIDGFNNGK